MKIHIFYTFKEDAWGGGNQFLKALKKELEKKGVYASSEQEADAVLFNGYQEMKALVKSYLFRHHQKRIYRLGPVMSLHRAGIKWKMVDRCMAFIATLCADAVIFQSQWSYVQARKFGFGKNKKHFIIPNAVDQSVFFKKDEQQRESGRQIRLVYTSWSSNENKGFSCLSYLDHYLDFTKYHMKFIGNTPVSFRNIQVIPPLKSVELARELRESDIFVSPAKDDACSNAILEALACGLPVIALASGGNGELVDGAGLLFSDSKEMMEAIDAVSADLKGYAQRIKVVGIGEIADKYIAVIHASIR